MSIEDANNPEKLRLVSDSNAADGPMAHVDRMQHEAEQLKVKMEAINGFLESDKSAHLKPLQRQLLQIQYAAMFAYLQALSTRINNELDLL